MCGDFHAQRLGNRLQVTVFVDRLAGIFSWSSFLLGNIAQEGNRSNELLPWLEPEGIRLRERREKIAVDRIRHDLPCRVGHNQVEVLERRGAHLNLQQVGRGVLQLNLTGEGGWTSAVLP